MANQANNGMPNTKGGLTPATIKDISAEANNSTTVSFMFNPHQYTITLAHKYKDDAGKGGKKSKIVLEKVGQPELTLPKLIFDTYVTDQNGQKEDVQKETDKLLKLMEPVKNKKSNNNQKFDGRPVQFSWGSNAFKCYIVSTKQTFTLFDRNGIPLRAEVELKLKVIDPEYRKQNPTSGEGPINRSWRIKRGDRIDSIAAAVYGDATAWKAIAEYNNIDDPFRLKAGQEILIPPAE